MSALGRIGYLTQTTPVVPDSDGVSDGSSTLPASIEKTANLDKRLAVFSTKSVLGRDKSAKQTKSLCDEIRLRRNIKADLISSKAKALISSKLVWISP